MRINILPIYIWNRIFNMEDFLYKLCTLKAILQLYMPSYAIQTIVASMGSPMACVCMHINIYILFIFFCCFYCCCLMYICATLSP